MTVLDHIFWKFADHATYPKHKTAEYNSLNKSYSDIINHFMQTLPEDSKKVFLELEAQRNLIAAMDEENMFCFGFTIGVKLILEVLYCSERSS